jgi:hypothetical protein
LLTRLDHSRPGVRGQTTGWFSPSTFILCWISHRHNSFRRRDHRLSAEGETRGCPAAGTGSPLPAEGSIMCRLRLGRWNAEPQCGWERRGAYASSFNAPFSKLASSLCAYRNGGKMRFDGRMPVDRRRKFLMPTAAFHQNVAVLSDCLIGTPEISDLLAAGRMNRDTSPA